MKKTFYSELNENKELGKFISNFMSIKSQIGSGVGAGKLFERLFVHFINKTTKLSSVHMNLMNNHFIWDIIVSKGDITTKETELIEICRINSENVEQEITNLIGNDWIGLSLKTYKENACQITTDYSYREWLDTNLNGESTTDVEEFFSMLNKYDNNRYIILALNTYEKTNKFSFRELSFNKEFERINFKQNKKLSQYNLISDSKIVFKVLYGKNQANAFQRGIWTAGKDSINYFDLIVDGTFEDNNYFENAILSTII